MRSHREIAELARKCIQNDNFTEYPFDDPSATYLDKNTSWTIFHELAFQGILGLIPEKYLNEQTLGLKNEKGDNSMVFWARIPHQRFKLNTEKLNPKLFTDFTKNGTSIIYTAAEHGNLKNIPKKILETWDLEENTNGLSPKLIEVTLDHNEFQYLPLHRLNFEIITKTKHLSEMTILQKIVMKGELKRVAHIKEINAKLLETQNFHGKSLLHWIAIQGKLNETPIELLSLKGLSTKDKDGNTPLNYLFNQKQRSNLIKKIVEFKIKKTRKKPKLLALG
jgi:hypothetical protein